MRTFETRPATFPWPRGRRRRGEDKARAGRMRTTRRAGGTFVQVSVGASGLRTVGIRTVSRRARRLWRLCSRALTRVCAGQRVVVASRRVRRIQVTSTWLLRRGISTGWTSCDHAGTGISVACWHPRGSRTSPRLPHRSSPSQVRDTPRHTGTWRSSPIHVRPGQPPFRRIDQHVQKRPVRSYKTEDGGSSSSAPTTKWLVSTQFPAVWRGRAGQKSL